MITRQIWYVYFLYRCLSSLMFSIEIDGFGSCERSAVIIRTTHSNGAQIPMICNPHQFSLRTCCDGNLIHSFISPVESVLGGTSSICYSNASSIVRLLYQPSKSDLLTDFASICGWVERQSRSPPVQIFDPWRSGTICWFTVTFMPCLYGAKCTNSDVGLSVGPKLSLVPPLFHLGKEQKERKIGSVVMKSTEK